MHGVLMLSILIQIIILGVFLPAQISGDVCYFNPEISDEDVSRHFPRNHSLKSAWCRIKTDTLSFLKNIPKDIENLSIKIENFNDSTQNVVIFEPEIVGPFLNLSAIELTTTSYQNLTLNAAKSYEFDKIKYLSFKHVDFTTNDIVISNLTKLEFLRITHCKIEIIDYFTLSGLKSLTELYVVKNNLREIEPFALQDSNLLRRLSLSHNEIEWIHADSLAALIYLEILDLRANKIDHLSSLSFPDLPHLVRLELADNPIKVLMPDSFKMMPHLKRLSLGHQQQGLYVSQYAFHDLSSLHYLHVPNMDNQVLEKGTFNGLIALLHLRLRGFVQDLGAYAFQGLENSLRQLVLSNCSIKWVNELAFRDLKNLTSLDLSTNKIEVLTLAVFESLESLRELILTDNKLTTLPANIFGAISRSVKSIRLDSNPWHCDCELTLNWNSTVLTTVLTGEIMSSTFCNRTTNHCETVITVGIKYMKEVIPLCATPTQVAGRDVFSPDLRALNCSKV